MKMAALEQIVDAIGESARIVAAPGCGAPSTLLQLFSTHADQMRGSRLYSGLLLDGYPFLEQVRKGTIGYSTWHVTGPIRQAVSDGVVPFHPLRASQVPGMLAQAGVDIVLVRVAPPDSDGYCSLGPVGGYTVAALAAARLIVAEIDPEVPRVYGTNRIPVDRISFAIPSELPMPRYRRATVDETSRSIAANVLALLPSEPTLQIGIGSIPEAIVELLREERIGGLRFEGMITDGIAELGQEGLLRTGDKAGLPPIRGVELMGSRVLMDFADGNPDVRVCSVLEGINPTVLHTIDRFVSINSAIEVALDGSVNAEFAGDAQVSGIGGSADFVESAMFSAGGLSLLALPARHMRSGSAGIVSSLSAGTPVTIPRHGIDTVVTEHGVAHLRYASLAERRERLAAILFPQS